MRTILATVAGVLMICSVLPYLADMLQHKTKPNIVSWLTWTMLTSIATAAVFASHEPRTAVLTLGSAISTGLVLVFGLHYGFAKFSLFDGICQAGAVVGLLLWLLFNNPTIAIVASISIDFVGALPTLRHSWREPGEETWQTFLISTIAAGLSLMIAADVSVASLAYPTYLFVMDGAITLAILLSRRAARIANARS